MEPDARARLKAARVAAKLSVRELSRRVGISASMLSQIENGRAQPSVATLYSLVSTLSISLDELLTGNATRTERPAAPVVTPDKRAVLVMDTGVTWERLTPGPDPLVDALLVTYPPGSTSSSGGGLMRHTGHEYGFLLSGRLTVHLGFDTFVLEAGSSINFDSATPHAYVNESSEAAQGIWHVVEQNTADATSQTFAQRRYSAAEENGDVHERVDAADTTGVKY
ncbi:helix-turn-helix domain-containing protein [Mycolicibacterium chlorophenolicum]|uniref:HTH-type transcriptional regulator PuuR n=1 Tax=Mycolicibacterium chlorophenolicum TaxID=37916 RepID=A0A0J6WM21_9MYCO|nr:XRE family transcriptional regulator [Mycolicibacterium chlorophenolicum]KMO83639.1 HTH-type transcriptional regulator PuuR [Mycolicibacterium chlorophenolicum]